jgi:hypothetical protein
VAQTVLSKATSKGETLIAMVNEIVVSNNMSKTLKLSKLQRYILLEAAKSLPGLEERAKKANGSRQEGVSTEFVRPGSNPVQPSDLSHITRSYILIDFYKLTLRKYRFRGEVPERDTDRIDAQIAEQLRCDRANASLYRSTKQLEARGLIRRISKGGLQLTEQGIRVARSLSHREPAAIGGSGFPVTGRELIQGASGKGCLIDQPEGRRLLKDAAGIDLEPPARKTIDLEGRIVKEGVRKALRERQTALADLVYAVREYRTLAESKPLTLQGSDYAHAVQELNKAIDRAEGLIQSG